MGRPAVDRGAQLTTPAFSRGLPGQGGGIVVAVRLMLFPYSTLIGWSDYGEKALGYLIGARRVRTYRAVFCMLAALGAVLKLETVSALTTRRRGAALPVTTARVNGRLRRTSH